MADEVLAYVANYHPLLGHLMQQIEMVPLLSTLLDDDAQAYGVDADTVIAGMIQNILSPEPIRLYRLAGPTNQGHLALCTCPSAHRQSEPHLDFGRLQPGHLYLAGPVGPRKSRSRRAVGCGM